MERPEEEEDDEDAEAAVVVVAADVVVEVAIELEADEVEDVMRVAASEMALLAQQAVLFFPQHQVLEASLSSHGV